MKETGWVAILIEGETGKLLDKRQTAAVLANRDAGDMRGLAVQ